MVKYKNSYLITIICFLINSCGLHLRGYNNTSFKFPFKNVYLDCDTVIICKNLHNVIINDELATIVTNQKNADATIKVYNEQTTRDSQGFNNAGRISSYILSYQVSLKILNSNQEVKAIIPISSQIVMNYNDATILSNNQQENKFWDLLHSEATNQLVRRIVYFKNEKK